MNKDILIEQAIFGLILCTSFITNAQITITEGEKINYTIDEANATKWDGFAKFELSAPLVGTTGLGLSAGGQAQYKLSKLPITLAARVRYDLFGLADVTYKGETYGPSRNIELAAMLPIIPGVKKESKVKVTTKYSASTTRTYEEYFYADGEKKNDLLARGGLFQYWTKGNFSSTGLTAGLTFRMRSHVDVSLKSEEGYHREVFNNRQIYADLLYAPIIRGIREDEGYNLGARVGFAQAASSGMDYYAELQYRPGVIIELTFGWLFGWNLK
jgi:hypothetical protein